MTSLVVMGVSGCGKSHVGAVVAERLGLPLVEGDEFHSEPNRARMRDGIALTDDDRADWLDRLGAELRQRPGGAVLTCSALKASYRDRLRSCSPGLRFAWLDLDPASPGLSTGIAPSADPPQQGTNDFGKAGYGGPCPPSGTHHYHFTLYALPAPLGLDGHPDGKAVRAALAKASPIAKVMLIGTVAH